MHARFDLEASRAYGGRELVAGFTKSAARGRLTVHRGRL
jgi:hypothetical protein